MAEVSEIVPDENRVETSIGNLSYDYLVIAIGTKTNYFGNETIKKFGMPMKTVPQALNIRSLILQNFEKAAIANRKEE